MRTISVCCVGLLLIAAAGRADEMRFAGRTVDGTFNGYSENTVRFSGGGKQYKERLNRVDEIKMTEPCRAKFQSIAMKEPEEGLFKGFSKSNLIFEQDGKEVKVYHAKLKLIELMRETGGGDAVGGAPPPPPALDIEAFEKMEKTPAQATAFSSYKTARNKFDEFVAGSAKMKQEMDATKGERRVAILEELRKRKHEEQQALGELAAAHKGMMAAFPDLVK